MAKRKIKISGEVEVIASGYEFICPNCETFNEVIEVTETVTCKECEKVFEVADHHHATA